MLNILKDAGILNLLSSKSETINNMSRPDKIYCDNGNIMSALVDEPNTGSIRESFFLNQLQNAGYKCTYPKQGDFIAIDGTEVGYGNRIPLWLFGFLY